MKLIIRIKKLYTKIQYQRRRKYIQGLVDKGLKLGKNVDIIDSFFFDPSHCFLISIGNNCTICPNVRIIAHDASTKKFLGYTKIGRIEIKDNCFIGDSVIILPGVEIGPNAIIGAGSVVTNNIPPNTVAAGNPAKIILSLQEYLDKIKEIMAKKKVFSEGYFIERLDEAKRKEIFDSIGKTIAFIV